MELNALLAQPVALPSLPRAVALLMSELAHAEPSLRRALVARYGLDRGREATADALAWGFEHWDRLADLVQQDGAITLPGDCQARHRHNELVLTWPVER